MVSRLRIQLGKEKRHLLKELPWPFWKMQCKKHSFEGALSSQCARFAMFKRSLERVWASEMVLRKVLGRHSLTLP